MKTKNKSNYNNLKPLVEKFKKHSNFSEPRDLERDLLTCIEDILDRKVNVEDDIVNYEEYGDKCFTKKEIQNSKKWLREINILLTLAEKYFKNNIKERMKGSNKHLYYSVAKKLLQYPTDDFLVHMIGNGYPL